MSEIKNGMLGLYGAEQSKSNHMMTLGFKYNDMHGWKWGKEIKFRYASLSISPPLFLLFTQSFPSTLSLPLLGALLPKPIGSLGSTVSCPAKPDRETVSEALSVGNHALCQ